VYARWPVRGTFHRRLHQSYSVSARWNLSFGLQKAFLDCCYKGKLDLLSELRRVIVWADYIDERVQAHSPNRLPYGGTQGPTFIRRPTSQPHQTTFLVVWHHTRRVMRCGWCGCGVGVIFQKPMQLGSPNMTYKCSTMRPVKPIHFGVKRSNVKVTSRKTLTAWVFTLLWVLSYYSLLSAVS